MAELSSQERLQPSLLDRLTDHEPGTKQESRDQRVLSVRQLKECVRRDMSWLLNTGSLDEVIALDDFPQVAASVLNFGMPSLTGASVANTDERSLERRLRNIIARYEPRIMKNSLRISVVSSDDMSRHALSFEIECDVWAEPVPESMYLKTEVDLETGAVSYVDRRGG